MSIFTFDRGISTICPIFCLRSRQNQSIAADAFVGVHIELENMNGQIVGRILIYCTAVKFINKNVDN